LVDRVNVDTVSEIRETDIATLRDKISEATRST
jgi:hypothetical protein